MDTEGTAFAAVAETTSFLHYFSGLPDHRQASKVDYPLPEVLLLILLAVLAGAEAFTDIARFGERKIELLRRFRPYVNGTPSHDHQGRRTRPLWTPDFRLSGTTRRGTPPKKRNMRTWASIQSASFCVQVASA